MLCIMLCYGRRIERMKKENAIHICAKSCCVSMGWTKGHLTYICTTWKFNSKARCRHRMAEDNNDDSSSGSAGNHQQQLHSHFFFVVFCVYCSLSLAVHFVSVSGDRHPGISFFLVCKPLAILIWLAHFIRFSIFFCFRMKCMWYLLHNASIHILNLSLHTIHIP